MHYTRGGGEGATRDVPFHTEALRYTPPMRRVHHTDPDCPDGAQIQRHHRQDGTGTKPLCRQCSELA
jgi:hypothetical protein